MTSCLVDGATIRNYGRVLQQRVRAGGLSRSHGASRGESTSLSKADLQKSVLNHESLSRGIPNREIVTTI
jgi:hypothetical protein